MLRWSCILCLVLALASEALGQPTYKLEVKSNLKPAATLRLEGDKISRGALKDDPGFRLQYSFKKEGKPLTTVEARSNSTLEIPDKTPGTYTVVLEVFYPTYKTGNDQKGQFKPVSNELTYQVKPPEKAGGPVQIVVLEAAKPASK